MERRPDLGRKAAADAKKSPLTERYSRRSGRRLSQETPVGSGSQKPAGFPCKLRGIKEKEVRAMTHLMDKLGQRILTPYADLPSPVPAV